MQITISIDEYNFLKRNSDFLECLEACGVDNWDGYSEAKNMFNEEDDNAD